MTRLIFLLVSVMILLQCNGQEQPGVVHEAGNLKKVIFFGDSLTAGKGVLPDESFPSLIGGMLERGQKEFQVVNAGVSGDTTGTALTRLDWVLANDFSIFVIELGANDAMRGIPVPVMKKNLLKIIRQVREKNPRAKIVLLEMKSFPNMGVRFSRDFDQSFREIATAAKIDLIPFFLKGVAGVRELNQEDGIHPTARGHKIIAEYLYSRFEKLQIFSR